MRELSYKELVYREMEDKLAEATARNLEVTRLLSVAAVREKELRDLLNEVMDDGLATGMKSWRDRVFKALEESK